MATNETRVDTTFVGLLLIGFVLLLFGIYRLQCGDLFGTASTDLPLDDYVLADIFGVVGLILILLTIFAYRTGKSKTTMVFPFVAMFLFAFYIDVNMSEKMRGLSFSSNWFLYIAVAIFFLIVTIYLLVEKAPKFLAVLLLILGLVALFYGLACFYGYYGPCYDPDVRKAFAIVGGIFALLGFLFATYLGLAYADPKKIPLI